MNLAFLDDNSAGRVFSSQSRSPNCHPAASNTEKEIERGPKKEKALFYWINSAEKEIPFPLWAQRPIRTDNVTRVLVLPSLRRVRSPEGQVGFITAEVLSDICHRDRPTEIIGMGFSLSLSPPAFSSLFTLTHTFILKCVPKLVCKPCLHISQYLIFK